MVLVRAVRRTPRAHNCQPQQSNKLPDADPRVVPSRFPTPGCSPRAPRLTQNDPARLIEFHSSRTTRALRSTRRGERRPCLARCSHSGAGVFPWPCSGWPHCPAGPAPHRPTVATPPNARRSASRSPGKSPTRFHHDQTARRRRSFRSPVRGKSRVRRIKKSRLRPDRSWPGDGGSRCRRPSLPFRPARRSTRRFLRTASTALPDADPPCCVKDTPAPVPGRPQ